MKAKPKKSRSLSLVGGSVWEIDFKIVGDKIPTVREKLVKSLGRFYSIPLTDRRRGTNVQISRVEWIQLYSNNTCVSVSEFLLVFPKWVYTPILETYSSQYPHW